MGLADTIRDTFGVGTAATDENSAEVERGVTDHRTTETSPATHGQPSSGGDRSTSYSHTPGAFPTGETPSTEYQHELGSQSQPSKDTSVIDRKGLHGHEHQDSGVALSDVTGSGHPKTVDRDALHNNGGSNTAAKSSLPGGNNNTGMNTTLSDVAQGATNTLAVVAQGTTNAAQGVAQSNIVQGATTSLSNAAQAAPATISNAAQGATTTLSNAAQGATTTLSNTAQGAQNTLSGATQSHPQTSSRDADNTFSRSDVNMPTDPNRSGPASTLDNNSTSGSTVGGLVNSALGGESHNRASQGKDKSGTENKDSYLGSLPSAGSIYNTVTGHGSGEDISSPKRHIPASGDSEVAMQQAAGSAMSAHERRGSGVYNTVIGHGSSNDDASRARRLSAENDSTSKAGGNGIYNTISGAAAGGYNVMASTAQGVYNTVTGHGSAANEIEHNQPLTTTTSGSTGTERTFPLDNAPPTTTTSTTGSLASDRNPATTGTHDHAKHGHVAGAGTGAVAGAGAYDFLHRKETDAPDAHNEFVSNVNPYNTPQQGGWQSSKPTGQSSGTTGLFSDSELKDLSLRQKQMGTGGDLTSPGAGKGSTQALGSGTLSSGAGAHQTPSASRVEGNPTSFSGRGSEAPHSQYSNAGAGLAGAGLGAGAAYGASRLARDHDNDKHGATTGTSSTLQDSSANPQLQGSSNNYLSNYSDTNHGSDNHHHKARDVAALGAGGVVGSSAHNNLSGDKSSSGVSNLGGAAEHAPLQSTADQHIKERGTTVPSATAGKEDPYNHLSSGTPSGVSL